VVPRISLFANIVFGAVILVTVKPAVAQPIYRTISDAPRGVEVNEGPALPSGRGSHAGGFVAGHVIVAGGTAWNQEGTRKSFLDDSLIYTGGAWTPGPKLPAALAEGAFAADDGALYLAGGLSRPDQASDVVCKITWQDGQFHTRRLTPLPTVLSAAAAAISNGRLYVACGYAAGKETADLWSLDLNADGASWIKLADLPAAPRAYPALAACGGDLYLLGGLKGGTGTVHDRTLADVWHYGIAANQWTQSGTLPLGGYCWSAAPIDAHHLLLAGRADGRIHDEFWRVDLQQISVQLLGKCVIQATCAPLVPVGDHTWWLIGGEPDSNKHRTDRISVISLH
jgi:Galactose oxidase, central domain